MEQGINPDCTGQYRPLFISSTCLTGTKLFRLVPINMIFLLLILNDMRLYDWFTIQYTGIVLFSPVTIVGSVLRFKFLIWNILMLMKCTLIFFFFFPFCCLLFVYICSFLLKIYFFLFSCLLVAPNRR